MNQLSRDSEQSLSQLNRKIDFLHTENTQLKQTIDDMKVVIDLNKNQIRQMLSSSLESDLEGTSKMKVNQTVQLEKQTMRSGTIESRIKALHFMIDEKDREIGHLMKALEKVQKERDFAQGKALINEEITLQAEQSEKHLVQQLEMSIQDLQKMIQTQSQKISKLEKDHSNTSDTSNFIIRYRDVVAPNQQTILMHDEMENLHSIVIKLQLQINYLKSIQKQLTTLVHKTLSSYQQNYALEENMNKAQEEFINILANIQQSSFTNMNTILPNLITPSSKQNNQHNDFLFSPALSPLPIKVLPVKRRMGNVNMSMDQMNFQFDDEQPKKVIPKLNLEKALQIQQINAKRSTQQQQKLSEEALLAKLKTLETQLFECKQNLQHEMLLSKNFEIENEQMRRNIVQLEQNNEILIKSNLKYQEDWQRVHKGYIFYKQFYVEHKDQFYALKNIVQSEKDRFDSVHDLDLHSARFGAKKETRRKKTAHDLNKSTLNQFTAHGINDISSLIEVEKAISRKFNGNSSVSYNFQNSNNANIFSDSLMVQENDFDLGVACMDRNESSFEEEQQVQSDWKESCKRQWVVMANQLYSQQNRDLAQRVKAIEVNRHMRAKSNQQK